MSTGIELDRGQVALRVDAERLGAVSGSVAYRMALERVEGGTAVVLRLELTTGPAEDDPREWDFGAVVFASGWLTGSPAGPGRTSRRSPGRTGGWRPMPPRLGALIAAPFPRRTRAPSFPSFEHAAEDFFHGRPLVGVPPHLADLVVIREQDEDSALTASSFRQLASKLPFPRPDALAPATAAPSK